MANRWGNNGNSDRLYFGGPKIIADDGVSSQEIKRCLLLGRKAMTNLVPVQPLSRVWLFATSWTVAHQASLSITNSQSLLKLMSIESVMPSSHLILYCPLLLLPSMFPRIRVFSNESALCIRWPKYWSLSFNISPSNEHPGLISFRMDWLDLLAQKNCTKKIFMTQIIMMVWSLT